MDGYQKTVKNLENAVETDVEVNIVKKELVLEGLRELVENTCVSSAQGTETKVCFFSQDSQSKLAEARIFRFKSESTGVIRYIYLSDSVRGKGISRILRYEVVENMNDLEKIYSEIVNSKLVSVALDQGFRKIREGPLEGWFIREN
jgi:predicted GNAT family acetyltransferase